MLFLPRRQPSIIVVQRAINAIINQVCSYSYQHFLTINSRHLAIYRQIYICIDCLSQGGATGCPRATLQSLNILMQSYFQKI